MTPAPPSTAFVAASIWSGTGDVKTSPGHAASSMPTPTKPPWSGSCPEPPPEMRATLPATGTPLRRTSWFSKSIVTRSGCAAPSPESDSLTRSSGLFRNFFTGGAITLMMAPLEVSVGGRRLCDGLADRLADGPRVDDAEDREHEDRGPERFGEHRGAPARHVAVEVDDAEAVAEVDSALAEGRPHRESSEDAADELSAPVERHFTPWEALGDSKR